MNKTVNSSNPRIMIDKVTKEQNNGWQVVRLWYELRRVDFIFFKRWIYFYFAELTNDVEVPKPKLVINLGPVKERPFPDVEV